MQGAPRVTSSRIADNIFGLLLYSGHIYVETTRSLGLYLIGSWGLTIVLLSVFRGLCHQWAELIISDFEIEHI